MKKIILSMLFVIFIGVFIGSFIEIQKPTKVETNNSIVFSVNKISNDLKNISNLSKEEESIIIATSRGLVKSNVNGNIEGDLVKDFSVEDNGIEYTFILKDDLYWSDGSPLDVNDVKQYFKELLKDGDEDVGALLSIYGAKEFREGKTNFDKGVAISTEGNTINIRLNEKNDNFLLELTKTQYRIRSSLTLWKNLKESYSNINYSGDYYINKFSEDRIELVNKDESENTISFIKDENNEKAMASYEVGERDIVMNPPNNTLEKLYREGKGKFFKTNKGIYLYINSSKEKLNLDIRRKLSLDICKITEEYSENNSNAVELSEGSYFRKDKENLEKLQSRKVSISKISECNLPSKIRLIAENTETIKVYTKYLVELFQEKNIEIDYTFDTKTNIEDKNILNKYDIALLEYEENSNDRGKLYNEIRMLCDEKFDDLVLEDNIYDLYKFIPLMFINENVALSDRVDNLEFDSNGAIDLSNIIKK